MTAHGQLAIASEFRFDYWKKNGDHLYYVVKRGKRDLSDRWGILDDHEFGFAWNGKEWGYWRSDDMYRYTDLEEALTMARRLAIEANQEIIEAMEAKFPGEFRGGPYDLTARKVT